jgi:hypothetical protein
MTTRREVLAVVATGIAGLSAGAVADIDAHDDAQAITVRIVRGGNQDPYIVNAHIESKWVDLVRKDKVLQRDILRAVLDLVLS